ncbi:MAG: hypothetical protein Q9162_001836 [Coniocarpon cinnabarinum]
MAHNGAFRPFKRQTVSDSEEAPSDVQQPSTNGDPSGQDGVSGDDQAQTAPNPNVADDNSAEDQPPMDSSGDSSPAPTESLPIPSDTSVPSDLPSSPAAYPEGLSSIPGSLYGITDPAKIPTDIFLPNQPPAGPTFIDEGGCLCALRGAPDGQSTAWRCFGNHSLDAYTGSSGQWFNIPNAQTAWLNLPLNDSSNPPDVSNPMVEAPGQTNGSLTPLPGVQPDPLNVYDQACSGRNQSSWTTSYYEAEYELLNNQTPVAAAPCYLRGALPIQIQNVTSWQEHGCLDGFYCPNNTMNSLPQYCPPIDLCLETRLAGLTCQLDGVNFGMGPFEPVVCTAGYYCPHGGKEQIKCPSGHYCPVGSLSPIKCTPGAICRAGAWTQYYILPLGLLAVLDTILILLALFFGWYFAMADHRTHRLVGLGQQMSKGGLVNRKGYGKLEDETEMTELGADVVPLRRRPTGFLGSLSGNAKSAMDLDTEASPELQAFVESMRKAIHRSNFGLSFGFSRLSFCPKGAQRPVLQDISGNIKAGSLVGVMGGSGAGKSTFVNVLMGKQANTGGEVAVNGVVAKMKSYKKIIGYVPQDDIVLPELSVRENMLHSARIRLPKNWSRRDINTHVNAVIDCLELSDVSESLVGTVAKPIISGGQRKRVSIGMELAATPMAIFLDEPTSGLDATAANSIMRTLKALSKLGITVIVIIHQPRSEIFEMIDNLILLGNGQMIYEGPEEDVKAYFEHFGFRIPAHANQGDVVTDIITGNGRDYKPHGETSKEALIGYWQKSRDGRNSLHKHSSTPPEAASLRVSIKKRGAPYWTQTYYCLTRALLQQYRQRSSFWFEMGVAAIGGFLIGLANNGKKGAFYTSVYPPPYQMLSSAGDYRSAPEMALLVCIAVGLIASSPAVKLFAEEKLIYRRESESGHSRLAYYVAKVISTIPRIVLGCLHFTVPFYLLSTPPISWVIAYWLNLLYFFCIYGLASAVAMVTRREDAPLLAVMASLIVGVLSGAAPQLAKVNQWHIGWLWRMSPGTWMAEAYFTRLIEPVGHVYQLEMAVQQTGYTLDQVGLDCAILVAIGFIYRLVAFGGLLISPKIAK